MADIFRYDGQRFVQVPGSLRQIVAGNAQAVWGVNDDNQLFRYNSATNVFDRVPVSADIRSVSVGQTGEAWMLTTDMEIIRLKPATNSLEGVPGALLHIAAASGGFAWGLDSNSNILLYENKISKQIPGKLAIISTGPVGNAWGLNANSDVFFSDPDTSSRFLPFTEKFSSISVGEFSPVDNFAQVWGLKPRPQRPDILIREHDVFRLVRQPNGKFEFAQVPGAELMVVSAAASDVWGINAFHKVFQWNPQATGFLGAFEQRTEQQLNAISVGNNAVWGLVNHLAPPR